MFKKTISGLSFVAAAVGLAALSAPAAACTDDGGQAWDCIHDGANSVSSVSGKVYTGSATLSHWYTGTISCNDVRATGDVTINNNGSADLSITDFTSSNSTNNPDCSSVTFHNFNWTGSHNGANTPTSETDTSNPVTFTVGTVVIEYNGTEVCRDSSVDVTFNNDGSGGSYFDFDTGISGWSGTCNIDGRLSHGSIAGH